MLLPTNASGGFSWAAGTTSAGASLDRAAETPRTEFAWARLVAFFLAAEASP